MTDWTSLVYLVYPLLTTIYLIHNYYQTGLVYLYLCFTDSRRNWIFSSQKHEYYGWVCLIKIKFLIKTFILCGMKLGNTRPWKCSYLTCHNFNVTYYTVTVWHLSFDEKVDPQLQCLVICDLCTFITNGNELGQCDGMLYTDVTCNV